MNHERTSSEQLLERVLDLAVYAPVGMAIAVREQLPKRVKQGRQAMENRVQLARFIGQLAVQTGQREIAKRLEEQRRATSDQTAERRPDEVAVAAPLASEPRSPTRDSPTRDSPTRDSPTQDSPAFPPSADMDAPRADELPISDYESLAAIHVVERLRSMRPDEIELIRRFESAHRCRRTILAKIDQLQAR